MLHPYAAHMDLSAEDVAAELRKRLPGVGTVKLHKLLYYAQGHHLATFGTPLFKDAISAWDMGPVVGTLWHAERENLTDDQPAPLGEAELNTVGYVVSRYGALSGTDLRHLTHSERPWQDANTEWLMSRLEDPYQGVTRADGFDNLWYGTVPGSAHGTYETPRGTVHGPMMPRTPPVVRSGGTAGRIEVM